GGLSIQSRRPAIESADRRARRRNDSRDGTRGGKRRAIARDSGGIVARVRGQVKSRPPPFATSPFRRPVNAVDLLPKIGPSEMSDPPNLHPKLGPLREWISG